MTVGIPGDWYRQPLEEMKHIPDDQLFGEIVRRNLMQSDIAETAKNGDALYTAAGAEAAFGDTDIISVSEDAGNFIDSMIDYTELETARADLFSGRRAEALIHLERALGGDFVGRLAVA